MTSLILIAAPAAGKGTEADLLKKEYNLPHISTGDILREKAKENSQLGKEIAEKINNGIFVSDDLIIEILKERIQADDCTNGYILDGFPRDLVQAQAYDDMLLELNKDLGIVIVIDVDKSLAKARISGRRLCPNCGDIYNINNENAKPKEEGICDSCGSTLIQRADDTEEKYDERYQSYINKTAPLIDYYDKKGNLYHVDGSNGKEKTHQQIKEIIENI